MDWQEVMSLLIVAGTAAAMAGRVWRRRRTRGLPCATGCGCSPASPPPSVTYAARKGERPQVRVRFQP